MTGATVVGLAVAGMALGNPGVTVGFKVDGEAVEGLAVAGVALGKPGVNVGAVVVGLALG